VTYPTVKESTVNKATNNKATTNKSTKVSCVKLPETLTKAWDDIETGQATILGGWFTIGDYLLKSKRRGLQERFVEEMAGVDGFSSGMVSKAVTIAKAQALGGDFDWQDYGSFTSAYNAARAELNGGDVPEKQERKTSVKVSSYKANDIVKALGKAEAKKLALAILALA
jgi:hypothetical protein